MILPASLASVLILLVLAAVCTAAWPIFQKLTGKWRFELFYYDFSFGVLVCALVAAFTMGQFLPKELSFSDNFLIASKRQMVWGIGAGIVFNLGNILMAGALSVSGLSAAMPMTLGVALIVESIWSYIANPTGFSAVLLLLGVVLVVVAVIALAFGYSSYIDARRQAAVKAAALHPDPRAKKAAVAEPGAGRSILLSVLGGLILGFFPPLLDFSRESDSGVAPYGLAILFASGVLISSLFYIPFFLNFPVDGPPIELADYFKGTGRQHLLGLIAGIVLMAGLLCGFTVYGVPSGANAGAALTYAGNHGAILMAILLGALLGRDFRGAGVGVKMLLLGAGVLFAAGIGIVSISLHAG
jgi:glucose uptake protein